MRRMVLSRGMTLLELIVVMALLAIILSLSTPWLSRFFAGRGLDEEARRMLALTGYARSQAIAAGVPMELWIDTEANLCGLSARAGYGVEDKKPVEYQLGDGLGFDLEGQPLDDAGLAKIVFSPDGTVDPDGPQAVVIQDTREGREKKVEIALADDGLHFEIRNVALDVKETAPTKGESK